MKNFSNTLRQQGLTVTDNGHAGDYTTMGIGGKIGVVVDVSSEAELICAVQTAISLQISFIVLGGGSNTIFPDSAPELAIIKNNTHGVEAVSQNTIRCQSGTGNARLLSWCASHGLSGSEFLAGIPGTVGGAAAVNAGAFGSSMDRVVTGARIIDTDGQVRDVDPDYFKFSYRFTVFKFSRQVILSLLLGLAPGEPEQIRKCITDRLNYRRQNHPCAKTRSAGCFFKNPKEISALSAGKLIEQAGLRGFILKNLALSDKHANFVINRGEADFRELKELVEKIIVGVRTSSGITLEREVLFISPEGIPY